MLNAKPGWSARRGRDQRIDAPRITSKLMNQPFETLIAAIGANAIVLGAMAYLFKTLISSRMERDLLEFKSAIERKASGEIERFRSQLEKDRLRLQISYGGIFERQANAIIELYEAVIALERGVGGAIHFGGTTQERSSRFEEPLSSLRKTINDRRILLPPRVDTAVENFLEKLPRAVRTYISTNSRDFSRVSDQEMEAIFKKEDRALEILEKEIPALRDKLVSEMRIVIGVISSEF